MKNYSDYENMALDKPPTLTDKFFIVSFDNGTRELFKFNTKKQLCRFLKDNDGVIAIDKFRYADLANAISQRVYDYQFAFEQFIQTEASNVAAYQARLAALADIFSDDLDLYAINGPDDSPIFPPLTTKAAVVGFQEILHGIFRGFTLHTAPNVRVRPICGSTVAQASSGVTLVDYSLLDKGAGPLSYMDIAYYNFNWKYEADNVWRIVNYRVMNKQDTLIPPSTLAPIPFFPYPDNPPSNCS